MSRIRALIELLHTLVSRPIRSAQFLARATDTIRSETFGASFPAAISAPSGIGLPPNPLRGYFDARTTGRGIWKWHHYFDLYHRHLQKFVGTDACLVEIGVFSGGSLEMWRHYLGPRARVTGIDIAEECKVYEQDGTSIFIGDQSDRSFWARFRQAVPRVDIVIDDGGHTSEQQRITLEETLAHLAPGGVYICEDIHGRGSHFAAYVHALADQLNASAMIKQSAERTISAATALQAAVNSISFYPYAVVIERAATTSLELIAEKRGTQWQPFLNVS